MASETVDPIDWSHPPPYTGQYSPELHVLHTAMRALLQIIRLTALNQPRTCDLRSASSMHCLCGHSGYKVYSWWHCWKLCADTDGNSAGVPISPRRALISACRAPISPCWVPMLPQRASMSPHRAPISSHRMVGVWEFHDVSQCFKSVSWCFTCFTIYHNVLQVLHDVLLCLTMFSEARND